MEIINCSLAEYKKVLIDKYRDLKLLEGETLEILSPPKKFNYCAIGIRKNDRRKLLAGSILRHYENFSASLISELGQSAKVRKEFYTTNKLQEVLVDSKKMEMMVDDDTEFRSVRCLSGLVSGATYGYLHNNGWRKVNLVEERAVEYSEKSGESETAKLSEQAKYARELSEQGEDKLIEKMMQRYMEEEQKKKEDLLKYIPTPYLSEPIAIDLHSNYDIQKLDEKLQKVGRVLITGPSGAGKTALAQYYVAKKFGYNIGTNAVAYKNILFINGRASTTLLGNRENPGILIRFIKYIKENNIEGPYIIIYNEAQNGIDTELEEIWDLWSTSTWYGNFQTSYGKYVEIPKNLYWIFTACSEDENVMDKQVINRLSGQLAPIELNFISSSDIEWRNKLINNLSDYYKINKNTVNVLVDSIGRINDVDRGQVISLGDLLNTIKNRDLDFILNNIPKDLVNNSTVLRVIKQLKGISL